MVTIIAPGGETRRGVIFRFAVDLIREQKQVIFLREFVQGIIVRAGHQVAGWVVRRVDDNGFGVGPHQMTKFIQIERPAVFVARPPRTDVTADALRHFPQGLVARRMDDDVVAFIQRGVHEKEDSFLRTGVDEYLFRLDRFVEFGNLFSQSGASLRFGISEPGLLEFPGGACFQREQVRDGHGFTVR